MPDVFAVYVIRARTTLGSCRVYVGACRVLAWGGGAQEVVQNRLNTHMVKGAKSAAWLRPTSGRWEYKFKPNKKRKETKWRAVVVRGCDVEGTVYDTHWGATHAAAMLAVELISADLMWYS